MKLNEIESLPDRLKNNLKVRAIASGQTLFRRGDKATELYIIQSGYFKEIRYLKKSKIATLQMLSIGESLGETSLIFDNYISTVVSQVNSEVIAYPIAILSEIILQYPDLLSGVLEMLCQKVSCLQDRLAWRDINPSQERILQYLQHQAFSNSSEVIKLKFSLQEIAAELGFTPETLSRAFNKLEAAGTITRRQNEIILRDFDAA